MFWVLPWLLGPKNSCHVAPLILHLSILPRNTSMFDKHAEIHAPRDIKRNECGVNPEVMPVSACWWFQPCNTHCKQPLCFLKLAYHCNALNFPMVSTFCTAQCHHVERYRGAGLQRRTGHFLHFGLAEGAGLRCHCIPSKRTSTVVFSSSLLSCHVDAFCCFSLSHSWRTHTHISPDACTLCPPNCNTKKLLYPSGSAIPLDLPS